MIRDRGSTPDDPAWSRASREDPDSDHESRHDRTFFVEMPEKDRDTTDKDARFLRSRLRRPRRLSTRFTLNWHEFEATGARQKRQVGPLECTSARKADFGAHGGGGAGKILKKFQAWLSIRRQDVRRC